MQSSRGLGHHRFEGYQPCAAVLALSVAVFDWQFTVTDINTGRPLTGALSIFSCVTFSSFPFPGQVSAVCVWCQEKSYVEICNKHACVTLPIDWTADNREIVVRISVSSCFAKAFQRVPRSMITSVTSVEGQDPLAGPQDKEHVEVFVFEVSMEIKEEDGRGGFSAVPKDRSYFKLRVNLEKQLCITVQQVSENDVDLEVERCFGVLVSPGRNVKHSDMQLLEMIKCTASNVRESLVCLQIKCTARNVRESLVCPQLKHTARNVRESLVCPQFKCTASNVRESLACPQIKCTASNVCESLPAMFASPWFVSGLNAQSGMFENPWFVPSLNTQPGMFVSPWFVSQQVSMGSGTGDKQCYVISGQLDPTEPEFESLNIETPREGRLYITVAVDLVIRGIQEPVRFLVETPVKVFPQNERFWYFSRRPLIQQFTLHLKEIPSNDITEVHYEVVSIETSGEMDRNRMNLTLNLASLIRSPSITSVDIETLTPKEEDVSDGDEPLLSGTGEVSKDCSEGELESWAEVLARWTSTKQRPRKLSSLVLAGIPEALRGEESVCENVIQRDINRTFPAHDFFKEAGGVGQDSLYHISKAYAVYDSEVGYCQGLSFLAATLLLHVSPDIPLAEQLPQLWQHFSDKGVESHMFASQWFLTLFTARFPLYFVFHILDVFLLQGVDTLFQVALALLMVSTTFKTSDTSRPQFMFALGAMMESVVTLVLLRASVA
uniref:Rab-GAP TBC domain-containing protein n=1 Tax=Timema cristinae TaxID=61476 RepID=A0A7R9D8H3_TIMCR|nr:unnamed protein product [Timema cristinae]